MTASSHHIGDLLNRAPVIPVIVIDEEAVAVPLARALVAGGLTVLEVTLRTKCALASIKRIVDEVPDAIVGAGTILTPADVAASVEAGAEFLVSPGCTPAVLDAMLDSGAAPLPGAATASEVMVFLERGLGHGKFFPAQPAGGIAYLKALAGPIPDFRFCPTGGIDLAGAPDFLALPNVACVGGSWITPKDAVAAGDWGQDRDAGPRGRETSHNLSALHTPFADKDFTGVDLDLMWCLACVHGPGRNVAQPGGRYLDAVGHWTTDGDLLQPEDSA